MSSRPSMALTFAIHSLFAHSFSIQAADLPFAFTDEDIDLANMTGEEIEGLSASFPDLEGVPPIITPPDNERIEILDTGGGPALDGVVNRTVAELNANATSWYNKGNDLIGLGGLRACFAS